MTPASVGVARGILRNAGSLFLVGIFGKGAGLVIAVLIARYLGADAMGLFAVLFSVSVLIEAFISLGMSDSLVRDVAAKPSEAAGMFTAATKLVAVISVIPVSGLLVAAFFAVHESSARECLYIMACGTPFAGAFVVAQSVLQGSERVLVLTWTTFVARIASLVLLASMFVRGAGLPAAFLSHYLFQLIALVAYAYAILGNGRDRRKTHSTLHLFSRAVPFAVNNGIRELSIRLPALVLPVSLGLSLSGIFDSANRVRSALGMTMGASIRGLMPALARSQSGGRDSAATLIGYSVKYMCMGMSIAATFITLCAAWIISFLYGSKFDEAALPLQLLAWAQVLTAVDAVLQQAMLSRHAVFPAIRHSVAGVMLQCALLFLLSVHIGLTGASLAVLLSSATMVALDLRYVVKHIARVPVWRFAGAPLAASIVVATAMIATVHVAPTQRVLVALGGWAFSFVAFRALPRAELKFMWRMLNKNSQGSNSHGSSTGEGNAR